MSKTLRNTSPFLITWAVMVLYLIGAPIVHDRFFVREGLPTQVDVRLPSQTDAAKAAVDAFEINNVQSGLYQVTGWAFPTTDKSIPAGDYERQVVLVSSSRNYVFPAQTTKRIDVQKYFIDLGVDLNMSGFTTYINRNTLDQGTYSLGLIFKNNTTGVLQYMDTGRCVTRTPNELVFESVSNFACQSLMDPTIGQPVKKDMKLPSVLKESKVTIDSLVTTDEEARVFQLVGWVFPTLNTDIPAAAYERQVVLSTPTGNFIFPAEMVERPDVQEYFDDLGMDVTKSGFSAVIRADVLEAGFYRIGLILKSTTSNSMYFVDTGRCLRRTARTLRLKAAGSPDCEPR